MVLVERTLPGELVRAEVTMVRKGAPAGMCSIQPVTTCTFNCWLWVRAAVQNGCRGVA